MKRRIYAAVNADIDRDGLKSNGGCTMKRYVRSETDKNFCRNLEQQIIDGLSSKGVKPEIIDMLDIHVAPAGSGFRATVVLPTKLHRSKHSSFFYKREANDAITGLTDAVADRLLSNQDNLLKPSKPKSSTAIAVSLARNSKDPEELMQLATHNAMSVREAVAKNINTPSEALVVLAEDEDHRIAHILMDRWNIPSEVLTILAEDEDDVIRSRVARNPNTPSEVLAQLATDEDSYVRGHVAENPNTDPEVLAQLATDEVFAVRYDVAKNPNTPLEVLEPLAEDEEDNKGYLREIVMKRLRY